ncbi:MAG: adenylate/guanylate cyclase domain-containing protein [Chloroflexi bacterium]|nr:adenylate/guanylate cyclase domain-containing protein [Chloroflexota bacterium]
MAPRLRLWSGLVLFVYVATHLLNHAVGLVSLQALEAGRDWFVAIWRLPPLTALLYASLPTHVSLVLRALYLRRHLRMPRWEVVRLSLGLVMPLLLAPHIFGTRVAHEVFGYDDTYSHVVFGMWLVSPESALLQSILLVIAWVHGCMGLHYWLKLKPWYAGATPVLYAAALLLPTLSLLGFAGAGQALAAMASNGAWYQRMYAASEPPAMAVALGWGSTAVAIFVTTVVSVFVARRIRTVLARRRGVVRLTYPGGRTVEIVPGMSILEASRAAGIPHASVCGGRGRCSTCRSRLAGGIDQLPMPTLEEARVLKRVGAPPNVRLACQLRPMRDLDVFPLLPPTAGPPEGFLRPTYLEGMEQEIAILFADIRSFTKFSEHRLPYDVVFVLNRYFRSMGEAVTSAGGHLDKFIGDGVMALFGLQTGPERGCREALEAARGMAGALVDLNRTLANELHEPLRIGIGIHVGPVIVGEMGHGRATSLTAIGDAVNTASRLESENKVHGSQLIVSEDVVQRAGVDFSAFESHQIEVRGRSMPLSVRVVPDALGIGSLVVGGLAP